MEVTELGLRHTVGAVGRQKDESGSGSSFVDVVQTSEHRPRDHLPIDGALAGHRSLQRDRPSDGPPGSGAR